jgi:hypothetical protein
MEGPIRAEASAANRAWPAVAAGLRGSTVPATREAVQAAARSAAAVVPPGYVTTEEGGLTGPAVGPASLLKAYAALTARGWRFIAAAVAAEGGSATTGGGAGGGSAAGGGGQPTGKGAGSAAAAARFLRANVGLYISCVYDGHYDLSLIGKALTNAYKKLGGEKAFGRSLTQRQIDAVAAAYSIPAGRLVPHPPLNLAV